MGPMSALMALNLHDAAHGATPFFEAIILTTFELEDDHEIMYVSEHLTCIEHMLMISIYYI